MLVQVGVVGLAWPMFFYVLRDTEGLLLARARFLGNMPPKGAGIVLSSLADSNLLGTYLGP